MVTRCFTADGSGTNQMLCAYYNVTTLHVSFNQLIVKLRCLPAHIVDHYSELFYFLCRRATNLLK